MSILSETERAALAADYQAVADSFARPFTVYKEPTKTVLVTNPNYNPYQSFNQNDLSIQNTPNVYTISGRIMYDKYQDLAFVTPHPGNANDAGQIKIKDQTSRAVRVKVDASGHAVLRDAKKIEIDGELFDVASMPRPHGLFGAQYWTYCFVRDL